MVLESLVCPNCGCRELKRIDFQNRFGICPACNESFVVKSAEYLAKVEVDRTKDLQNFREHLRKAVLINDVRNIAWYARNILDLLPTDFSSTYYYAYAENALGEAKYLRFFYSSSVPEHTKEEMDSVIDHILRFSDLRDRDSIERFLSDQPDIDRALVLADYRELFQKRVKQEELYDDIPRDVFICHRSTDQAVVDRVLESLENDGNECWVSFRNLRPNDSENYWTNIKKAIRSCKLFLVVSGLDAMLSKDVKREMEIAKELGKPRLEYKIDHAEHTTFFKYFFDGLQWVEGYENSEKQLSNLRFRVYSLLEADGDTTGLLPNPQPDPIPQLEPPVTIENEVIAKSKAIQLFRKVGYLISNPITFASKNSSISTYWANPEKDYLRKDWSLILNDSIDQELHLFMIPRNSISESSLKMRTDRPTKINMEIIFHDPSFTDSKSGLSFLPYYVATLTYKGNIKNKTKSTETFLAMSDQIIHARTHAEFLNKVFGTNYTQWMKSTWDYSDDTIVWMVRFNGENSGYQNRILGDGRIIEIYTEEDRDRIMHNSRYYKHPYRLAVAIEEPYGTRQYRILGLYKINHDDAVERKVYFDPVPLEFARKKIPEAFPNDVKPEPKPEPKPLPPPPKPTDNPNLIDPDTVSVGTRVFHRKYGLGQVSSLKKESVMVSFSDVEKQFLFPDAFINGFLMMPQENG